MKQDPIFKLHLKLYRDKRQFGFEKLERKMYMTYSRIFCTSDTFEHVRQQLVEVEREIQSRRRVK